MSKQWEYRIVTEPPNLSALALQSHLTAAGIDEWELIIVLPSLVFIFKRERRMVQ